MRFNVMRFIALLYLMIIIIGGVGGVWGCRHRQDFGKVVVNYDIHNNGYLNGRVVYIGWYDKRVQVVTVENRLDILFEADEEMLNFLEENSGIAYLLPVTFDCRQKSNKECDRLYVSGRKVKPVLVQDHQ